MSMKTETTATLETVAKFSSQELFQCDLLFLDTIHKFCIEPGHNAQTLCPFYRHIMVSFWSNDQNFRRIPLT